MNYVDNIQLVNEIKALYTKHGMLQKDLAIKMGVSPANLSNILKNKRSLTFEDVNNICHALGYKLEYNFINDKADK